MASTESHLTGGSSAGDRRSSDEIRRDIERRRDELDVTTEVLQHKLAPRELAEQLWHDMRTRLGGGAGEMVDVVKRHPVPLGLIGAGIAWWIYETSRGHSLTFGNGGGYEEEDLGVGSMSTGSYRSGAGYEPGAEYASSGYSSEGEGWRQRSRHAAQRSSERLRSGAHAARQGVSEAVERNPLALGAACFSLGLLAGIAVPASRWEDETMGDASTRVSRKAVRAAKGAAVNAAEQGARAAQSAAERLREEAERSSSEYRGTREGEVEGAQRYGGSRGTGRVGSSPTGVSSTGTGSGTSSSQGGRGTAATREPSRPGGMGTGTSGSASPRPGGSGVGGSGNPATSRGTSASPATGTKRDTSTPGAKSDRDERDPWDKSPGRE